MPSFPDLPEPLAGDAVALRLAAERDIPEVLIAHQDDPTLYRRLRTERPPSGAELGRRAEGSAAARAEGRSLWLTVLVPENGPRADECRGQVDVHDVDWDHRRAALSVWIAPRERGRGLGAGALGLAARWLLRDCGLERVQVLVEPANDAMRRAAAAAGFSDEGVLRSYLREPDGRVDVAVLSLVRADVSG